MPQNLELKARISSLTAVLGTTNKLCGNPKEKIHQKDIYYRFSKGRLKLRIINGCSAELIFYRRPNRKEGRYSDYYVLPVSHPKVVDKFCTNAFGRIITIMKERQLFLYQNARIHLDTVRGLGTFIEFEVMVETGKTQARKLFNFLYKTFSIRRSDICATSYSDLFLSRR